MRKLFIIFLILVLIVTFNGCTTDNSLKMEIFGLNNNFSYFEKTDDWKKFNTSDYFKFSDKEVYEYSEDLYDANDNLSTVKYYKRDFGTFPAMAAIGYGKILAYEFARQHSGLDDNKVSIVAQIYPVYTSTTFTSGYYNTLDVSTDSSWGGGVISQTENKTVILETDKAVDILFDPSGIPVDESVILNKDLLSNLYYDTVCYDSMVFFTNNSNPIENITTEQIREIYSGKIKNWDEVGGDDAKIEVYHRGYNTMNHDYMEKVVMKGLEIKKTNHIKTKASFDGNEYNSYPAEYVNTTNAIGYAYKSLVDKYYGDSVKILKVNGIEPTDENICSNKYPYSIPCLAVTRKDKSGDLGRKVIEWLKSDEGKKSITQVGFVPTA